MIKEKSECKGKENVGQRQEKSDREGTLEKEDGDEYTEEKRINSQDADQRDGRVREQGRDDWMTARWRMEGRPD